MLFINLIIIFLYFNSMTQLVMGTLYENNGLRRRAYRHCKIYVLFIMVSNN